MANEKGSLSINSENILPIIKKWLYSDTDIFLRELVSNGADAITKLMKLDAVGEADIPADEAFYVRVTLDKEAGTITVSDNGVGMTRDEVRRYINQIAFSGANEFIEKYKEKMEAGADIIGHFGLGFYSAFMVSKTVEIHTKSYVEDETPVRWASDGGVDFEMSDGDRPERGTDIILHLADDSKEFLDEYRLRAILRKYCAYMPVDVFLADAGEGDGEQGDTCECEHEDGECDCEHEHGECDCEHEHGECDCEHEDGECDCGHDKAEESKKPQPINDKNPLWNKKPADVTEQEYRDFYHKAFTDWNEPLFWIHLNMDFPFRLKGILYFPKLSHELESIEGQVKLYNNQVFIAENIKEVIPEFLLLLKGVMDCPDLPLNVSRSALQNDGFVAKMSTYITKKVADKLTGMLAEERETYNKYWDDISPFVKYGCIKEKDFYEKVKDALLFKTTKGEYLTVREYRERNEAKTAERIVYVTDEKQQAQYLVLTDEQNVDAVLLGARIDNPFMSSLEGYERESKLKFVRIDSDLSSILNDDAEDGAEDGGLAEFFKAALGKEKLAVRAEALKNPGVPAIVILSEEDRRMREMSKMFGGVEGAMFGAFDDKETLVVNLRNPLVRKLSEICADESRKDDAGLICEQVYDLAMMSHRQLSADDMNRFIKRSSEILLKIAD